MTPGDVVRAYLKLFETQDAAALEALIPRTCGRGGPTSTRRGGRHRPGRRITRFWGETDLWGLLRQLGKVPDRIDFS